METADTEAQGGAIETKRVAVSGLSEGLRKKEMERLCRKLEKEGWKLKEYNDAGISGSHAIFSRPLSTKAPGKKGAGKKWPYAVAAILVLFAIIGLSGGDKSESTGSSAPAAVATALLDKDMAAFKGAKQPDRAAAVSQYLAGNGIDAGNLDQFYNFMSEAIYTKDATLKVNAVLAMAKDEFTAHKGKFARQHWNLDEFEKQFSAWDGSHRNLETLVKSSMNDEDSYKHIETRYRLVLEGANAPYVQLVTTFSGKNAFGGTVKNTVRAKARIDGTVFDISE